MFTRKKSSAPFTIAKPTSECYGPLKSHSALTDNLNKNNQY